MTETVLHFVFASVSAGCLVQALRKAGRDDQVITTFDDLSFGPIDPGDSSSRAKWVETELGQTGWNDGASSPERLWDEARLTDNRKIAWLTRRSAMEYAGFLNWLWRLGDERCEVDLTDVKIPRRAEHGLPDLAISLGMLHPELICDNRLWDLARPLEANARSGHLDLWRQLRSENTTAARGGWRRARVGADFIFRFDADVIFDRRLAEGDAGRRRSIGMPDGRLHLPDRRYFAGGPRQCLAESGRLEVKGKSPLDMRFSEVRIAKAR